MRQQFISCKIQKFQVKILFKNYLDTKSLDFQFGRLDLSWRLSLMHNYRRIVMMQAKRDRITPEVSLGTPGIQITSESAFYGGACTL